MQTKNHYKLNDTRLLVLRIKWKFFGRIHSSTYRLISPSDIKMSFIVLFPPEQAFDQVRWDAELIEDFRLLFNLSRFDKIGWRVPVFFLVQLLWFQLLKGYETVKADPKPVCMSIFAWNTGSVCRNQIVHIFDCRDESIEVFLISQNFSQSPIWSSDWYCIAQPDHSGDLLGYRIRLSCIGYSLT